MRDSAVYGMHEANARRSALVLGQFEFLKTRQEAFERVLRASRWTDRLRWTLDPKSLLQVVDAVQASLMEQSRKRIEAEAGKARILQPNGIR